MQPETWIVVASAPCYEISSYGAIRRVVGTRCRSPRSLSPRLRKGYLAAHLSIGNKRRNGPIHLLVCEAFHGPRPSARHVAAHSDGNPLNNHADNLRWATVSENVLDRYAHGNPPVGEGNSNARLTAADVSEIRLSPASGPILAAKFGVSRTQISRIRRGKSWTTLREEAQREAA